MRRTEHENCLEMEGPDLINAKTCTPPTKVSKLTNRDDFASERIQDRSIKPKEKKDMVDHEGEYFLTLIFFFNTKNV